MKQPFKMNPKQNIKLREMKMIMKMLKNMMKNMMNMNHQNITQFKKSKKQ